MSLLKQGLPVLPTDAPPSNFDSSLSSPTVHIRLTPLQTQSEYHFLRLVPDLSRPLAVGLMVILGSCPSPSEASATRPRNEVSNRRKLNYFQLRLGRFCCKELSERLKRSEAGRGGSLNVNNMKCSVVVLPELIVQEVLNEDHDAGVGGDPHVVSAEADPQGGDPLVPDALGEAVDEAAIGILPVEI